MLTLVRTQSKRNLSVHKSKLQKSISSLRNSVIRKSSYVDWASHPSLCIWTGVDAVQEENSKVEKSSSFQLNSVIKKSSYVDWPSQPAQIFGLVQMQSKMNPSLKVGLPQYSILLESSCVQWKITRIQFLCRTACT